MDLQETEKGKDSSDQENPERDMRIHTHTYEHHAFKHNHIHKSSDLGRETKRLKFTQMQSSEKKVIVCVCVSVCAGIPTSLKPGHKPKTCVSFAFLSDGFEIGTSAE